jgi:hypothetical protein
MAYKASDLLAFKFTYESIPTTDTQDFNHGPWTWYTASLVQVASFTYGMKMGGLLGGFSAKTFFYNFETINTTYINTNAEEYEWGNTLSGFKTEFKPSAVLAIGDMNLYTALDTTLNFTKLSYTVTNKDKWYDYSKPALLQKATLSAMITKNLNDKTTFGLEIMLGMSDDGYSFQSVTNGGDVFKTNSYVGGMVGAQVGIGARVKASDTTTFFVDLETAVFQTTDLHKKDADKGSYGIFSGWMVPSINLGAEFELVKNLKLRLSANSSYSITSYKLASYENIAADDYFNTDVSGFSVATSVGLGYKIGSFVINWELNPAFLNTVLRTPMAFININGTGPALASQVQVSYKF